MTLTEEQIAEIRREMETDRPMGWKADLALDYIPALLATLAAYGRAREQGGVNEDALRALAQAYDREDAAQRGEPDPWNLDDPGDIGDSDTWVSERLACARAAAEAFLSALEPAAPEGRQEDGLAPLFQPSHRGGV